MFDSFAVSFQLSAISYQRVQGSSGSFEATDQVFQLSAET